ncbi:MAG: two-component sensor histidine kinase [Lysobacterales bacterium 14-68-21]|jgi:two-component system sensor histidine kinase DesK|nr:MAG: two-component sensor histidine kinase [Xanthomonadales bacterium 15-68-25]OZB67944.1 MAG: two-component sensor histidine kinase [Xanthomonadales bacterium 14-68-21]
MPAERAGNGMPQSGLAATFRRLFRPHPESLLGRLHSPLYLRWQAVLQLASVVALVKLPMETRFEPGWLVATLLSLVPYLICYGRMYLRPIRQMPLNAAGLMLTALALAPFNQGAVVYLIVAGLTMALHPSWRAWIGTVIAASAAAAVVVATTGAPQGMLVAVPLASLFGGFGNRVYMRGVRRDAELRLSQEEVRRLATLAERERIGRDLHDLLGHTLSLVAIKSELARRLARRDTAAAEREMEEVERVARHALGEVRAAVTGMRRGDLAAELVSARLMLEASGILLGGGATESLTLPREVEAPLALVLREAVTNIHRHARATEARIEISSEEGEFRMRISDNGCGGLAAHGNGISGMRERLRALDGRLMIESPPRKGTTITVVVPLAVDGHAASPARRLGSAA